MYTLCSFWIGYALEQRLRAIDCGTHRRDAHTLKHLRSNWIIDAGDDSLRPQAARDLGGHEVTVVILGHRQEQSGIGRTRRPQDIHIDAVAEDCITAEVGMQPLEGIAVPIDHGDVMTPVRNIGDARPDSATAEVNEIQADSSRSRL